MRCDHSRVLVIDVACGGDGKVGVAAVRQLRGGREHLEVDSGTIHQSQPRIEFCAVACADPSLGGGVGLAETDEHVEVVVGPVVCVHVDPHVCQRYSLNATPYSVQPLASWMVPRLASKE